MYAQLHNIHYGFICECHKATQCYWQSTQMLKKEARYLMDSKNSSIMDWGIKQNVGEQNIGKLYSYNFKHSIKWKQTLCTTMPAEEDFQREQTRVSKELLNRSM